MGEDDGIAAVAANIGSGPDVVLAWNDDPHQYPDKLLDLTEVAEYLGKSKTASEVRDFGLDPRSPIDD